MATTPELMAASYPIPTYRYVVTVGDQQMAFAAVSGLNIGYETILYKDGTGGVFKMPGQPQTMDITLKRGVFKGKSELYDWISSISLNQVEKRDISISLTDATATTPLITWNVSNAFPIKLSAPNFDATSNEVAIEEITLATGGVAVHFH